MSQQPMEPLDVLVFAQTPPPEHGQSRMIEAGIRALRRHQDEFKVRHINARFSASLDEIGESSFRKGLLVLRYGFAAVFARFALRRPFLYYVPGPVKWSAILRDWFLLTLLRIFYRQVVFHWHAIGQGEWACGSRRVRLPGPAILTACARRISRLVLSRPYASICVSKTSNRDAIAVASRRIEYVENGIEDPFPGWSESGLIGSNEKAGAIRILYLSHGTEEKGLFDAFGALRSLLGNSPPDWLFDVTFAGGVSPVLEERFTAECSGLEKLGGGRCKVRVLGYIGGGEKDKAYRDHDVFLAPSRWESFGLTVAEAMAYGLRIVAVASDGVRGVLPEEYPYLCPTGDAPKLARVLWECCHDLKNGGRPDLPARLRSRFVENFTSEAFAGNFIRVWREFGNEKQPRPQRDGVRDDALKVVVYLADQNPGFDRSYGISRMTQIMLGVLRGRNEVALEPVMSKSSRFEIGEGAAARILPWGTKNKITRLLTDHLSPLLLRREKTRAIYYYPKGYLPLLSRFVSPSVVTIHDTIIQYDEDNYPRWRRTWEYKYWSWMLRHTLKNADRILTVSLSSRDQIRNFMGRHNLPSKEITVSYEPCLYERIPQPRGGEKEDFVLHLASVEPHKRTTHLIRWWVELERQGIELPPLHLVGTVPREAVEMLTRTSRVLRSPFLPDDELQDKYRKARALVLPSEIEGFGLPALESYYLGTPVCYVKGTSVEEVLSPAIRKGGFDLSDPLSLVRALEEVLALGEDEIHDCGLILRREYAASRVAEKMISVFQSLAPR